HRAVGGDDDQLDRRIAALQLPRELEAVAVGEHEVDDGRVRVALGERAQRFADAARRPYAVALALEREPEPVGDRLLVVDDQDAVNAFHGSGGLEAGLHRGWPEWSASRLRHGALNVERPARSEGPTRSERPASLERPARSERPARLAWGWLEEGASRLRVANFIVAGS